MESLGRQECLQGVTSVLKDVVGGLSEFCIHPTGAPCFQTVKPHP